MKITGTKSYIQIEEENGNIARFDGEACLGELPMGTGSILRFVWAPLYLPVRFSSGCYGSAGFGLWQRAATLRSRLPLEETIASL